MIALGRPRGACMIPPERRCAPLPPGGESLGAALRLLDDPPERRCAPLPPGGESLGAALRLSCLSPLEPRRTLLAEGERSLFDVFSRPQHPVHHLFHSQSRGEVHVPAA